MPARKPSKRASPRPEPRAASLQPPASGPSRAAVSRLRRRIDSIDEQLVRLLGERLQLAGEVAVLKKGSGVDRYIPWREQQILRRIKTINQGALPDAHLAGIFRDILGMCRQSQQPLVVAFPGPEGSLAHVAARQQFGASTHLSPTTGIAGVFEAVSAGEADYGVVPLETSGEGIGARALEYFLESGLTITAENFWKLELSVAGRGMTHGPRRLYVPEIVYALSRPWLAEAFPRCEVVQGASVAWAARQAADEPGSAAICPAFTAELAGLEVLRPAPLGGLLKELRFLTAGRSMPALTHSDKTTIAFSLADRVGILEETLGIFRRRRINLTMLESYFPSKTLPTSTFFADFLGHASETSIRRVLEALRKLTSFVKVLGSYPVFRG